MEVKPIIRPVISYLYKAGDVIPAGKLEAMSKYPLPGEYWQGTVAAKRAAKKTVINPEVKAQFDMDAAMAQDKEFALYQLA